MNIAFLTSGHEPMDDRIFYHMARSLADHNENVEIVSSKYYLIEVKDGIKLNCFEGENLPKREKIKNFIDKLTEFKSDLIICSEPLTLLAANRYSKKQNRKIRIVYDITEWYPSKKNLIVFNWSFRWLHFIKLLLFNILMARLADSFIFGEWYKSIPYSFLYPRKPHLFCSYYPDLKYIDYCPPELQPGRLRLSYSGKISLEKGYGYFFKVLSRLSALNKNLQIEVKIIGWYENLRDKLECEKFMLLNNPNISLKLFDKQKFRSFIEIIKRTDIFFDLRSDDFENQHCLPIKLFYFAAFGRPVIVSDLKSIRKEVEIDKFGFLVNPEDTEEIVKLISSYLNDGLLYYKHCRNARSLAEKKYNWQFIEPLFIKFILIKNLPHQVVQI